MQLVKSGIARDRKSVAMDKKSSAVNSVRPEKMSVFRNKGESLTSLCPWTLMADDGICLIKNGALMCAYEFYVPDLDSSPAYKINSVASAFNNAVMNLGEGWTVQFELQRRLTPEYPASNFTNLAAFLVERQREINFSYVENYYENRYYLTFTMQLPPEIEQKGAGLFYKQEKSNSGILDRNLLNGQIKSFKMECGKAVGIISQGVGMRALNSEELATYMHTSVSMDWHKIKLPKEYELFIDRYITDESLETSMPMRLGENYIPVVAVKAFPGTTIPAMFDALNRADCELRWSTRFMAYSKDEAIKKIDKAEKKFHSARKSVGQWVMETLMKVHSSREDSGAFAQEADASEARAEATVGACGFGEYTSNVMVWDKRLDVAEDKAKYILGIIGACGFNAVEEKHNALQAFLSMQPGNVYANIRQLFVSTTNMSHVIPISSVWSGLTRNNFLEEISGCGKPHITCMTDTGIPFFLNFNHTDVGHHWVSGPTGAGKSTYLALSEIQWLKYPGAQVIIFDKDLSARNVTMCVGGTYIETGKDDVAFQPLAELETEEEKRWAAEFIETLLSEQKVEISAMVRKAIYKAVTFTAEKPVEDRTLTTFWGYCDYADPNTGVEVVREGIYPYLVGGQYGNLFDRNASEIPISKWTMIEMGTLMNMGQSAVAPALMCLFRMCEKRFDGSPTLLILDEAWIFLKNEIFAKKIAEWLKVLRKKHVFVVFATQEIEDAAKSPVASTIISQCGSKVYLADEQANTQMMRDAYKLFGLDVDEIDLLSKSRKKQDYFFKSAQGARKFQLGLDALQLAIITNGADGHDLLDDIEAQHGKNTGVPLVEDILDAKKVTWRHLMD